MRPDLLPERATLAELVGNIGPMPSFLACGFMARVGHQLIDAHDHGQIHGDVRPSWITVAPLVATSKRLPSGEVLYRPSPQATASIQGLGEIPATPAVVDWPDLANQPSDAVAFLPPERLTLGTATTAGDVYGLGATLYYLLTARAPAPGMTAALATDALKRHQTVALRKLRKDLPVELIALIDNMLATDPTLRLSMAEVAELLAPFSIPPDSDDVALLAVAPEEDPQLAQLEPAPVAVIPGAAWDAMPLPEYVIPASTEAFVPSPFTESSVFPTQSSTALSSPAARRQVRQGMSREQLKKWLWAGAIVWSLGIAGWFLLVFQGCEGDSDNQPKKKQKK